MPSAPTTSPIHPLIGKGLQDAVYWCRACVLACQTPFVCIYFY
jgi:hypothetical protein